MGLFDGWFGDGDDGESDDEPEASEHSEGATAEQGSTSDVDAPEEPWATVLYPFPLQLEESDLEELLDGLDRNWEGVEGAAGVYRVRFPGTNIRLAYRDAPFPDDRKDERLLSGNFPDDHGHVAVEPEVADPLDKRDMLSEPGAYPDPWGDEEGVMRLMTDLIRGLLEFDGMAVVLNRSNQLAVPSQEFEAFTEAVDEGDWQAALAWLDIRVDEADGDEDVLRTHGLEMFGLPDLDVYFDSDDERWRQARRMEALQAAVAAMIEQNRVLGADAESDDFLGFTPVDEFRVPVGGELDDPGEALDEDREFVPYRIDIDDQRLVMRPQGAATVWHAWASVDDEDVEVELPAYRELFRHACIEVFGPPLGSVALDDIEGMEGIECDFYRENEAAPVHFVTNGLGRRARSTSEGEVRVELAIRAAEPADELVDILTNCAAGFELGDEDWGAYEILEFEEPLHNMQAFGLVPLVDVAPAEGPAVSVWQLAPLTQEEYEGLSDGDLEAWVDEHDGATSYEFAERWNAVQG